MLEFVITICIIGQGHHFSGHFWVSSTNKTDCNDIARILLKVVLNTITHNLNSHWLKLFEIYHIVTDFCSIWYTFLTVNNSISLDFLKIKR